MSTNEIVATLGIGIGLACGGFAFGYDVRSKMEKAPEPTPIFLKSEAKSFDEIPEGFLPAGEKET